MASQVFETRIGRPSEEVWDAVRDFGAVHERLVPGFLTDATFDGEVRTVTFYNGMVVRERLVSIDEEHRRVSYTNDLPGVDHHHASVQVLEDGPDASRFVWITDVLPDEAAGPIGEMMGAGIATIKETLDGAVVTGRLGR